MRLHAVNADQTLPVGRWDGVDGLYEEFAALIRLAHLLTGSIPMAEDVVQDAFIRVIPKLGSVEHPKAYLRAAVVNGCRSAMRSAGRMQPLNDLQQRADIDDVTPMQLLAPLKDLTELQRTVIVLRYYCDLSDTEIAEFIHRAPATVRVIAHRALAKLRKVVAP